MFVRAVYNAILIINTVPIIGLFDLSIIPF
jgi:hypothetical protein